MENRVEHNEVKRQFTVEIDGHHARMTYTIGRGAIYLNSTYVPKHLEGQGIAAALVKAGIEYAESQGLKVHPVCSYTVAYMKRHPEYAHLEDV